MMVLHSGDIEFLSQAGIEPVPWDTSVSRTGQGPRPQGAEAGNTDDKQVNKRMKTQGWRQTAQEQSWTDAFPNSILLSSF